MLKYFYTVFLSTAMVMMAMGQPPKQAVVYFNNGLTFRQKGMMKESIMSFKKAIAIYKKYDSAYLAMAMTYTNINQPDSAISILKNAVKVMPGFAAAYIGIANIYRDNKNNPGEAINNYLNAYKIDSTDKTMLYGLAWCYNVKPDHREAIKYAVKALEIDNNYNAAYNELGHAYHQLNAYAECIEQLKKNLAISVNDLPLLYSAYCYIELKQKDEATKIYEQLDKRNPKMASVLKKRLDNMQ